MNAQLKRRPAEFPSQVIGEIVRYHGAHQGDSTALIFADRNISYAELDRNSNRLANALLGLGLEDQACVAFLGKESEKYYELLFACAKANLVLIPINWRLKIDEVRHILSDSSARTLLVTGELADMVASLSGEAGLLTTVIDLDADDGGDYRAWLNDYPDTDPGVAVRADSIIAQLYTSGTTGLPKGVRLKHHGFFEIRQSLIDNDLDWLDWRADDVSLIGIPGFHIGGLWWSLQGFSAGIPNVSMPMFMASEAIAIMTRHDISITCLVPAMINMLLLEIGDERPDFGALRKIVYGGSPISESLLQQGIDVFGCEFAQIYGLTETGNTAVCLDPQSHLGPQRRLQAAGRAYPCVELKVIDEQGAKLAPGEVGEVCIRTPACMAEYWRLPEATAKTLVGGWIHTGDAGYLDEEKYLFICDRINDTIIVAGEKIYPAEVENAINKHPAINDTAVIGVPDKDWGERVVSFVVRQGNNDVTANELLNFLKDGIADYKIPSKFFFVDGLPRNPSGKILRRELRDAFWENRERKV